MGWNRGWAQDLVHLWARDESELWLPALLHPQQWGRTMAMWLMVPMKLDSKARLGWDSVVSLRQFSYRHVENDHLQVSQRRRQFLRLLLLGLPDEKLKKNLNSLFMSFFLFFFFYDWTYASIRNDRRTCGSFCLLDQSPEPYRYWAEVQGQRFALSQFCEPQEPAWSQYHHRLSLQRVSNSELSSWPCCVFVCPFAVEAKKAVELGVSLHLLVAACSAFTLEAAEKPAALVKEFVESRSSHIETSGV